jgi:penicillin-insensitive murein endopeptidase
MRRLAAAIVLMALLLTPFAAPGNAPDAAIAKSAAKPKKPLAKPKAPVVPARQLFGAAATPAPLAARAIGFYARGCLAGAKPLAIDGPAWQAMRLSRNRNWGHPQLVRLVERLATEAKANDGWHGLLVGDISQPRGGPMLTGHASHQIGLDADIWLTPMPDRRLSEKEREDLSATSMLATDRISVDPSIWTEAHSKLIRRAAAYAEVERVLVHPAIKKALCEAKDGDRSVLHKIRPYWGHHYHMHVRIACPKGSDNCEGQPPPSSDDGCGKELNDWIARLKVPPRPDAKPAKPKPPLTMAQLPAECKVVLEARAKDGLEARAKDGLEARAKDGPEVKLQAAPAPTTDAKRAHGPAGANPKQ